MKKTKQKKTEGRNQEEYFFLSVLVGSVGLGSVINYQNDSLMFIVFIQFKPILMFPLHFFWVIIYNVNKKSSIYIYKKCFSFYYGHFSISVSCPSTFNFSSVIKFFHPHSWWSHSGNQYPSKPFFLIFPFFGFIQKM